MDIVFKSKKLEELCNSSKKLQKIYGVSVARKATVSMNILRKANCLEDVPATPPCRRHKLSGSFREQWAVDMGSKERIIFIPVSDKKEIVLKEITAIKILEIGNVYH